MTHDPYPERKGCSLPSWAESNQRALMVRYQYIIIAVLFHCKKCAAQSDCCVQVGNLTAQFS